MQVGVPGKGTGAVCNSKISELIRCYSSAPHHRPNRVAVLTDVKNAALLAACPPFLRDANPDWQCVPAHSLCKSHRVIASPVRPQSICKATGIL